MDAIFGQLQQKMKKKTSGLRNDVIQKKDENNEQSVFNEASLKENQ